MTKRPHDHHALIHNLILALRQARQRIRELESEVEQDKQELYSREEQANLAEERIRRHRAETEEANRRLEDEQNERSDIARRITRAKEFGDDYEIQKQTRRLRNL